MDICTTNYNGNNEKINCSKKGKKFRDISLGGKIREMTSIAIAFFKTLSGIPGQVV